MVCLFLIFSVSYRKQLIQNNDGVCIENLLSNRFCAVWRQHVQKAAETLVKIYELMPKYYQVASNCKTNFSVKNRFQFTAVENVKVLALNCVKLMDQNFQNCIQNFVICLVPLHNFHTHKVTTFSYLTAISFPSFSNQP